MNLISEKEFMSGRESQAEQFAQEAEACSSYMLSSRASRHREEGSEAEEELQQFKVQIEKKYTISVANKIYTFPYTLEAYEELNDEDEYADLVDQTHVSLFAAERKQMEKPHSRSIHKVNAMLEALKVSTERIMHLSQFVQENFSGKKPRIDCSSKQKISPFLREDKQDALLRKRLYTEPYQKPMGFVIKKK